MNKFFANKKTVYTAFAIYVILLIWALYFKCGIHHITYWQEKRLPLVSELKWAFTGILYYIEIFPNIEAIIYFLILLGNVVAFVPFGIFLRHFTNQSQAIAILATSSFVFETIQLFTGIGGPEIYDLITNLLGGLLGLWLYNKIENKLSHKLTNRFCMIFIVVGVPLCAVAIVTSVLIFV